MQRLARRDLRAPGAPTGAPERRREQRHKETELQGRDTANLSESQREEEGGGGGGGGGDRQTGEKWKKQGSVQATRRFRLGEESVERGVKGEVFLPKQKKKLTLQLRGGRDSPPPPPPPPH